MTTTYKEGETRRRARLSAERSVREANKLTAYLAKRAREAGRTQVSDIKEQTT
jgi:hypothetical protein